MQERVEYLLEVRLRLESLHGRKSVLPTDEAKQNGRIGQGAVVRYHGRVPFIVGRRWLGVCLKLGNQPVGRLGSQFGTKVAIKGRWRGALLHMAEDVHSCGEFVLSLLRIQLENKVSRVVGVGLFISENQVTH